MTLLVRNKSDTTANTAGEALPLYNRDPVFTANNLLTTISAWVDPTSTPTGAWGGASVQLYISPQLKGPWPTIWFPVGNPITTNGYFSFQERWGQIKAEISGASSNTASLYVSIFDGYF